MRNHESQPLPIEKGLRQEELQITPESLLQDNHSEIANANRQEYDKARRNGDLIAYYRCSDARIKPAGKNAISWSSIAAADRPIREMASNRGIKASIALAHFDGDSAQPSMIPSGCGGLGAKENIGKGSFNKGIKRYVAERIAHHDLLIQALRSANLIAKLSEKPALAAAQDHLDLTIYPLALFTPKENGQMTIDTSISIENIMQDQYSPKEIYANGIPSINEENLPDIFREVLELNRKEINEINNKYPDLRQLQKVQKPRIVMVSTDIRSARDRYPKTSSVPGSIFKVHIPRAKTEGKVKISGNDIENAVDQLEYPISHAVENNNDNTKPFSNTDRLIIETGSLSNSLDIARRTMNEEWMQKWIQLHDRKIIVIQTTGGVAEAIEEFDPKK